MEVFINNQSVPVSDSATLSDVLLQHNFLDKKGIAVAVNNFVVSKAEWNSYKVDSADKITIIRATQGG
jgi:sulfur carrier protein